MNTLRRMQMIGFALGLGTVFATPAQEIPSAYQIEAQRIGIPAEVLYAIALTESGRSVLDKPSRPWPWVLNVKGTAAWFKTREDTVFKLQELLDAGITNIDIGLMQVNWGYHRRRFTSAADAVDPFKNLEVGARILKEAWEDSGDLWRAVGHYHSRTPERADQYRNRYGRQLHDLMLHGAGG